MISALRHIGGVSHIRVSAPLRMSVDLSKWFRHPKEKKKKRGDHCERRFHVRVINTDG